MLKSLMTRETRINSTLSECCQEQLRKQVLVRLWGHGNPGHRRCDCNLMQTLCKTVWRFLKEMKTRAAVRLSSSGYLSKGNRNINSERHMHPCSSQHCE